MRKGIKKINKIKIHHFLANHKITKSLRRGRKEEERRKRGGLERGEKGGGESS